MNVKQLVLDTRIRGRLRHDLFTSVNVRYLPLVPKSFIRESDVLIGVRDMRGGTRQGRRSGLGGLRVKVLDVTCVSPSPGLGTSAARRRWYRSYTSPDDPWGARPVLYMTSTMCLALRTLCLFLLVF